MGESEIIMPWGKFKGCKLHMLPSSYLYYLATNCDWNIKIQEAADDEWQYREHYNTHHEKDPR